MKRRQPPAALADVDRWVPVHRSQLADGRQVRVVLDGIGVRIGRRGRKRRRK